MPGGHGVPVNPFTAGGGSLSGRDSPMDTEGEDPGDEVINVRRSALDAQCIMLHDTLC